MSSWLPWKIAVPTPRIPIPKRCSRRFPARTQITFLNGLSDPPPGCKFHPRCRYAQEICKIEAPLWREISSDHWIACHLADELDLAGI